MKVLQYFIVLLTVCMSITSCSKDDKVDDSPNKGADDEEQLSYELKQPVIALEEEQLNYIVKAVDDTLFFNRNTPKECLPGIGTLLLENHATKSLPYGFYGKVMKIEEVHGLQAVIAEPLPLPEVFSELRLNRPINFSDYGAEFISEEGEVIQLHSTTRKGETEVGFPISVTGKYVGVTGTASLTFELLEFKLPDILSNEARISARATLKYGLSLTASISKGQETTGDDEYYKLGTIKFRGAPLAVILTPVIQVFFKVTPEGKLSFELGYEGEVGYKFSAKCVEGQWSRDLCQEREPSGKFDIKGLTVDGSISETFNLSTRIALFGNIKNSIGITPKIGLKQEAHLDLTPGGLLNGYNYEEMQKNDKITNNFIMGLDFDAESSFLGHAAKIEGNIAEISVKLGEYHFFPKVKDVSIEKKNEQNQLKVTYKASGRTLSAPQVGVAIYKKNEETPERIVYNEQPYQNPENDETVTEQKVVINDIDFNEEFDIRPVFKGYDTEIAANNKVEYRSNKLKKITIDTEEGFIESYAYSYDDQGRINTIGYEFIDKTGEGDDEASTIHIAYGNNKIALSGALVDGVPYSAEYILSNEGLVTQAISTYKSDDYSGRCTMNFIYDYNNHLKKISYVESSSGSSINFSGNIGMAWSGNLLTNMKEEGEDHLTQITYQSDVNPNTTVNIPYFMVFRYDDDTVSSGDNAILCYAAMLNILGRGPNQLMKSLQKAGEGYNNSFSFSYVWDEYGNLTGIQDYSVYSGDDSSGESYKAQIGLTYY